MPAAPPDHIKRALAEAETIRSMADLLAGLPDDQARDRVLRWCEDHFGTRSDDRQRPAASSGGVESDPALTIGDDVFDSPRRRPEPAFRDEDDLRVDAADIEPRQPEDDDDLIVDNDTEGETIHCDDLSVDEADLLLPPVESRQPAKPAAAGLESLLRDFVADFQRLALEWQTA